jgi:2,4-dienoyl-CoA reductase-like NADH-dependent reductase (Old Yellow Enzyme family)/thioredoxin reductase
MYDDPIDVLWEPLTVGSTTVRNRLFVSAHQTGYAGEAGGMVSDRYVGYLRERVRGGVGLVMTEVSPVHVSGPRRISAFSDAIIPSWRKLADAIQGAGGAVFAQLWHPGAHEMGNADIDEWHPSVAPSELQSVFTGRVARALSEEEIAALVERYGRAGARARAGGLDGVELHGGHGYLPCQFLSPMSNQRTDRYGGSVENRCRFLIEIAQAVRRHCGRDFTMGVRLSFDEYVGEAGLTPEASVQIVAELQRSGLFDFYDISGGNYHSMDKMIPTRSSGLDGHIAIHSAMAKQAAGSTAVLVASAVRTVERAAEIVRAGQADIVAMTRAHIADPQIVNKARAGRASEIRRCVGANQSCLRRLYQHGTITCTVNPSAGREWKWGAGAVTRAERSRAVLVVGGGPAGLKAAESAAQRGHRVTLAEREDRLGGLLLFAGQLPGRATWLELVEDLTRSLTRLNVEVRLATEVSSDFVDASGADAVVLATGSHFHSDGFSAATPARQSIPGAHLPHVLDPVGAIGKLDLCGRDVLVFDDAGDHVAGTLALLLAASGRSVEVATRHPFLGAGGGLHQSHDLEWLLRDLSSAGVRVVAQSSLTEIRPGDVTLTDIWTGETRVREASTVVLNTARSADTGLHDELVGRGISSVRIGDCLAPREVDDAFYEAMACGMSL